jgi:hypothetical protein
MSDDALSTMRGVKREAEENWGRWQRTCVKPRVERPALHSAAAPCPQPNAKAVSASSKS